MSEGSLDSGLASVISEIEEATPEPEAGIEHVTTDDGGNVLSRETTKEIPKAPEPPPETIAPDDEEVKLTDDEVTTELPTTEDIPPPEALPEPEELLQGNDLVSHMRKQGALRKQDAKDLREKDKRISELEKQLDSPAPEDAKKIAASDVFRAMVEIRNGDRPESDLSIAKEQIEMMSLDELDRVMERAENGFFGAMSEDVLEVVKANESRVRRLDRKRVKSQDSLRDWKLDRMKAWDEVRSIPGMEDKDSDLYGDFVEAERSLIKMFPKIDLQADAPLKVLDHMELTRRANATTKLSKLETENAQLRKQLNLGQGGLSTDGAAAAAATDSKEVSIERQFEIDIGLA